MNFPPPPDAHAIAVMLLTLLALSLFMQDRIRLETSSMIVIALLTLGFTFFPYHSEFGEIHAVEFFHGFGHDALVAVCALMVVGQSLVRTGALAQPSARRPICWWFQWLLIWGCPSLTCLTLFGLRRRQG